MSKIDARQCDNPECAAIVERSEISRVKVALEQGGREVQGFTRELCPPCTDNYLAMLNPEDGWEPIKRRKRPVEDGSSTEGATPLASAATG